MDRSRIQDCFSIEISNHNFLKAGKTVQAEDIMTKPVHMFWPDMSLIEAVNSLIRHKISGAPVVDHLNRVIGVVSEKEIISKVSSESAYSFMEISDQFRKNKACIAASMKRISVCDIMTSPAITAVRDASIAAITALFAEKNINQLPIIETDCRPIGIITHSDVMQFYAKSFENGSTF